MDIQKLKDKIAEKGLKVEEVASELNIDRSSLYRKLNNAEKITIGEARKMKKALNLSDAEACQIFLS